MNAHALPNRYVVSQEGDWTRDLPVAEAWTPTTEEVQATRLLALLTMWGGGVAPVYRDGGEMPAAWVDCARPSEAAEDLLRRIGRGRESAQLELGLPERARRVGGPSSCTCLWAWVESKDQARRAGKRFKPLPTLVLKMGKSCRRLLIWGLDEEVPYVSVVAANKRIAYALRAPQKYAEPEKLRIPLPATFLRVGRKLPSPVLVTRVGEETFTRAQVSGRLRDPPPPFMQRLRNGEIKR